MSRPPPKKVVETHSGSAAAALWPHDPTAQRVDNDDVELMEVLFSEPKPPLRSKKTWPSSTLVSKKKCPLHYRVSTYLTETSPLFQPAPWLVITPVPCSAVARFCQKRATHLSHLHDPMRNDWQLLRADLTGRYWVMQNQSSSAPEPESGGPFFFFFFFPQNLFLSSALLPEPCYCNA